MKAIEVFYVQRQAWAASVCQMLFICGNIICEHPAHVTFL